MVTIFPIYDASIGFQFSFVYRDIFHLSFLLPPEIRHKEYGLDVLIFAYIVFIV